MCQSIINQISFMVYKWTMAIQFSFEYYSKDHKSEEDYKAIAAEGAVWQKL